MSRQPILATMALTGEWDLEISGAGDFVILPPSPAALEQDVSSACMLFQGEAYYNSTQGVPYTQEIFGGVPALAVLQTSIVAAAESVPGVVSATFTVEAYANRTVNAEVAFVDINNDSGGVSL